MTTRKRWPDLDEIPLQPGRCPDCNCPRTTTLRRRHIAGGFMTVDRVCGNCGRRYRTTEKQGGENVVLES